MLKGALIVLYNSPNEVDNEYLMQSHEWKFGYNNIVGPIPKECMNQILNRVILY